MVRSPFGGFSHRLHALIERVHLTLNGLVGGSARGFLFVSGSTGDRDRGGPPFQSCGWNFRRNGIVD